MLLCAGKPGINAFDELALIESDKFEVFFSAHVLEPVPSVSEIFTYAYSQLKKNGLFIAFTPNGSGAYRDHDFQSWNKFWGMVHLNLLDDRFYNKKAPESILASKPYDRTLLTQIWDGKACSSSLSLIGNALMIAQKI